MHHRTLTPWAVAAFATFTLGMGPAQATVVAPTTLEHMTASADVIARASVQGQRVKKDGGRLLTYTTLTVTDGVKGVATGADLEVFQVGGTLDGQSSWIVGAHRFQKGEDLVFFGTRHPRGTNLYVPWGIGLGLFEVQEDISGTQVVELVGDVVVAEKQAEGPTRQSAPQQRRYHSYEAFRATLTGILRGALTPLPLHTTPLHPLGKPNLGSLRVNRPKVSMPHRPPPVLPQPTTSPTSPSPSTSTDAHAQTKEP